MMRIRIRADGVRLFLPVPVSLAGFVLKLLPEKLFEDMGKDVPEPYRALITKSNIRMLAEECLPCLKENRGLEIVHVEASDGTFVSIKL